MAQCPDGQIGGFRLLRLLGQGGMGEVWLADHPRLPRQVAVKVLRAGTADNPESRERFLREAETVARLEHPAIVDVFDRGEERGRLWIAMRFVDGEDLGILLRREGALHTDRALSIATPVADALDHAHDRGIIHRDVKPANILLPGSGLPAAVVTDFGIARAVDDDRSMTGTGLVVGSMPYISPEQIDGEPSTARSDLYGFACAVYEMLTGRRSFDGPTTSSIIGAHMAQDRPSLLGARPDLPAAADAVIQRALSVDPAARQTSATEFLTELRHALDVTQLTHVRPYRPSTPEAPTVVRPTTSVAPTQTAEVTKPGGSPASTRSRKPKTSIIVAFTATLVAAGGGATVAHRMMREPADLAAATSQMSQPVAGNPANTASAGSQRPSLAEPTAAATTGTSSTTTSSTTTSSTTTPASPGAPAPGDLGLSTPIAAPVCDGRSAVILSNAVTNDRSAQRSEIAAALRKWPQANYMRPSCASLRNVADGKQIYTVYLDQGVLDEISLCNRVLQYSDGTSASPYGKYLDNTHPAGHFYRWDATRRHCYYFADATGAGRRLIV